MRRSVIAVLALTFLGPLGTPGEARAASPGFVVVALQGTVEIQRDGAWSDAAIGAEAGVGDRLRTGANGRARVVSADDCVLDVAPGTEFSIDKLAAASPAGVTRQSLLTLASGKLHAWVGSAYKGAQSRFDVETPPAVVRSRGNEFLVGHNDATQLTEIVGIDGKVEVFGKLAVQSGRVEVGSHSYTQVQKGRLPIAPQSLGENRFAGFFDDLQLVGTGRRDGLNVDHPAVAGRLLSPRDVPAPVAAPLASEAASARPSTGEVASRPDLPLIYRLSQDLYTNTQPLLQYEKTPPGASSGSVEVNF